jgi:putative endonuclease
LPENSTRAERGRFGERIAARYCRRNLNYQIIARNWRYKRYEIDLICRDNEVLVFIEVRARKESALVSGYYSVDKRKKAGLELACKAFLRRMSYTPVHFRFDIIEVQLLRSGLGEPRHYQNIELFHKHFQPHSRTS